MALRLAALAALIPVAVGKDLQSIVKEVSETLDFPTNAFGCYADKGSDRVFTDKLTDDAMTKTICAAHCEDYPYYGLQWGKECWCGDYRANYAKHGTSSDCTYKCAGSRFQSCGGFYAMHVFTQAETDSASVGCYKDSSSRIFSGDDLRSENMSPSVCMAFCEDKGAAYYGTQYGNECWCGNDGDDLDKYGSGTCDIPCAGDPTKMCGGNYAMTVYNLDGSTSPSPSNPSSPTPVPPMPECGSQKATGRWASSTGPAGRFYFEGGGCATLTDLFEARQDKTGPKGPLYVMDDSGNVDRTSLTPTGKWFLASELYVEDGVTLFVHGTDIGGDCDELRIESSGSNFHELRAHGGNLSFKNTIVTSWDEAKKGPTDDYETGRSFINCVSEKAAKVSCIGQAKNDMGECRMDIINSEMGHLGWMDSESYGLTWKVRGFCVDKSNPEVFDDTNVYGDIQNSDIHHMYYGMYSYGHQGGVWTNNKMHDNFQYGFDPHDDSDYLTIANNKVYNNVNHGIIASKRCNNVDIYENEVSDGGAQAAGIFLHRSTDSARVFDNYVHDMYDAGLANLESFDSEVYNNKFENVKYGIRISLGGGNNYVHDNEFINCSKYGLYTYQGSDPPDVSDGRPSDNTFEDNQVLDTEIGVKIKEGDDIVIKGNKFTGTEKLEFQDSTNVVWSGNSVPSSACTDQAESSFRTSDGLPGDC